MKNESLIHEIKSLDYANGESIISTSKEKLAEKTKKELQKILKEVEKIKKDDDENEASWQTEKIPYTEDEVNYYKEQNAKQERI